MRDLFKFLMVLAVVTPSLACIGAAFYLAAEQREGWGWFLFVALLIAGSAKFSAETKTDGRKEKP